MEMVGDRRREVKERNWIISFKVTNVGNDEIDNESRRIEKIW